MNGNRRDDYKPPQPGERSGCWTAITGALLVVVALVSLLLAGCDQEKGKSDQAKPKASATAKPKAQPAVPPAKPGKPQPTNGAEPAPVQGDPSAHNQEPGEVDLYVEWTSEDKYAPSCEWSKNAPGRGHPCEGLKDASKPKGHHEFIGLWSRTEQGQAGDHFEIAAQGSTVGVTSIDCSIMYKGQVYQGQTNGRRCSIQLTLP